MGSKDCQEVGEDYYEEFHISFDDSDEEVSYLNTYSLYDAVNALALTPVLDELVRKQIFYQHDAELAVREYRKFLLLQALHAEPGGNDCARFVPPDEICEVWHTHILMTKKYAEDCDSLFGYFLHHGYEPAPGTEAYKKGIEIFWYLYEDTFGDMPARFTFSCGSMDREDYKVMHRRALEAGPRNKWPQNRSEKNR